MRLGLNLGLTHRGAFSNPYAGWDLAFDATTADGYVLNGAGVETINDLATGTHTTTQLTATRQATVASGRFVFDGTSDAYDLNTLAIPIRAVDWQMKARFVVDSFAANTNLMSFVPASGSGVLAISARTTGRIRFAMNNAANVSLASFDVGSTGVGGTAFSTGTLIDFDITVQSDAMTILLADVQIVSGQSFPTSTQDALYTQGSLGCNKTSGGSLSAFFPGKIELIEWKAL